MRYIFYAIFLFVSLIFLANSGGRAASANAGNTGAPGDQTSGGTPVTCQFCHNSVAIQVTVSISLLNMDGLAVQEYVPGETYRVRVAIDPATGFPSGYGFQMIPIRDSNNSDVKGLQNPAANVKISTVNSTGRTYAEHRGISNENTFEVEWVAPSEGTGSVTFYAAGNGVNRNNNSSGDGAANSSLKIEEGSVSATKLAETKFELIIYPNPSTDYVKIITPKDQSNLTLSVLQLSGSPVLKQAVSTAGETQLDLTDLQSGVYLLMLIDQHGQLLGWEKIVKL